MSTTMDDSSVTVGGSASATNYWNTFDYNMIDVEQHNYRCLPSMKRGETDVVHLNYDADGYYPSILTPDQGDRYAAFVSSQSTYEAGSKDHSAKRGHYFIFKGFFYDYSRVFDMPSNSNYVMLTRIQ